MGEKTEIAWCDHTFNPWWGCQRVSPGCENCYAETFAKRVGLKVWGPTSERRFFGEKHWREPLKWDRAARAEGRRHRVFCASMADVFEDRRDLDGERERLWELIAQTPWLDWLLLTKRPENIARMVPWLQRIAPLEPWPNVWLGTTCEDDRRARERVPELLRVPAAIRFISYEPALGPVDWVDVIGQAALDLDMLGARAIDWIIVGGESGPHARPFDLTWAENTLAQCKAAGVACFVKQLGAWRQPRRIPRPDYGADAYSLELLTLRDRKGGDWSEWPADLRVREFPRVEPSHV